MTQFAVIAPFVVVLSAVAGLALAGPAEPPAPPPPVRLTEAALQLHHECLVVDGHNDLPWALRKQDGLAFRNVDIARPQPALHTDLPRLKKGGVGAQFWSAYVPADTADTRTAVTMTLEQIDAVHRLAARYPDDMMMAYGTADIRVARERGKIACLIGVEGGHGIDNSLGVLRTFHRLGVRYMTLTHSKSLDWADSATDEAKSGGLSAFGKEVVREMNALGMLVDLSHVSPAAMHAVLDVARAPVIFSHSSARRVADHPRNVPDDVLKRLPANGGVVMVNFYSGFIVPERARMAAQLHNRFPDDKDYVREFNEWVKRDKPTAGTVHTIADHIDQIVKVAGIDHVGLGSDYDGVSQLPAQMEDVSCYPYLTQELLTRGYTPDQVRKILGENLMRAFAAAEKVARTPTPAERPGQ